MSRGNSIIVSAYPKGRFAEGKLGNITPKPGTIMQIDISEALVGGRHVFEVYNADASGGRPKGAFYVLLEDGLQGRAMDTAYAANDHCFLYVPEPGDELNLLVLDTTTGTGDDYTKGTMLIVDDTTGLMIATAGSPETEVAMLLEDITDPTENTLAWCEWTGY